MCECPISNQTGCFDILLAFSVGEVGVSIEITKNGGKQRKSEESMENKIVFAVGGGVRCQIGQTQEQQGERERTKQEMIDRLIDGIRHWK